MCLRDRLWRVDGCFGILRLRLLLWYLLGLLVLVILWVMVVVIRCLCLGLLVCRLSMLVIFSVRCRFILMGLWLRCMVRVPCLML